MRIAGGALTSTPAVALFRMCGKQRTWRVEILKVWQGRDLQNDFSDAWLQKELRRPLNVVKVLCFEILSQVFILNGLLA